MTENQPRGIAEDARQIISHMQAAQSALEGLVPGQCETDG